MILYANRYVKVHVYTSYDCKCWLSDWNKLPHTCQVSRISGKIPEFRLTSRDPKYPASVPDIPGISRNSGQPTRIPKYLPSIPHIPEISWNSDQPPRIPNFEEKKHFFHDWLASRLGLLAIQHISAAIVTSSELRLHMHADLPSCMHMHVICCSALCTFGAQCRHHIL